MADKIFIRIGSWYRASNKELSADIEVTGLMLDPNAEYPDSGTLNGGGGSETLDQVLANGATFTADREIELLTFFLDILVGGRPFFEINPSGNLVSMGPAEVTGSIFNRTKLDLVIGNFELFTEYNDDDITVKYAGIVGVSDIATSTITHTADNHTFNGRVVGIPALVDDFADDAAAATGGIEPNGLYHTAGVVKVRRV